MKASGAEAAGRRPGSARRIIEFRARDRVAGAILTSGDEHQAVKQQYRPVTISCGAEVASGRPGSARRIVEFGARESGAGAINTSGDEHQAVRQQRRRLTISWGAEVSGNLKNTCSSRVWLDEHQPRAKK